MRVCCALSRWCLLSLLTAVGGKAEQNLTFMLITSFGQFGFNSSGLMPAVDMALEDINSNLQVLPGYSLMYDTLRDSQVSACGHDNSTATSMSLDICMIVISSAAMGHVKGGLHAVNHFL